VGHSLLTLFRRSHLSSAYALLRDWFSTAINPVVDAAAEPGAGARDATGSLWKILANQKALRGGGQSSSPTWGNSKVIWTQSGGAGFDRVAGRTLVGLFIAEDTSGSTLAAVFGWDIATNTTDPRTVGHQLVTEGATMAAAAIGQKIVISDSRAFRPVQYLVGVTLYTTGALVWMSAIADDAGNLFNSNDPIGVPAYPNARIVWPSHTGTTTPLYPSMQALATIPYPNGNQLQDVRIIDAPALATQYVTSDTFTRADSGSSVGTPWVSNVGTWGISSNQAYNPSGSGFMNVTYPDALPSNGDGWMVCDITWPTPATNGVGVLIAVQDSSNYIRIWNNGSATTVTIQVWKAGGFDSTIASAGTFSFTAGETVRWYIGRKDNRYRFFSERLSTGVITALGTTWVTDSGNNFLTARGVGLFSTTSGNGARWDNLYVYPLTFSLTGLITGALPAQRTLGATLATDTFTDTNGTRLNAHTAEAGGAWTEHAGTWTIQSNQATVSAAVGNNFVTQQLSTTSARASVNVITPSSFPTNTIRAGVVARYTDDNTALVVRLFKDTSQPSNDEIELLEGAGSLAICHKINVGAYYAVSTTYTLALEIAGDPNGGADLCHVFLNGVNVMSYPISVTLTGTRWGLYREDVDDGCVFDAWDVRAV